MELSGVSIASRWHLHSLLLLLSLHVCACSEAKATEASDSRVALPFYTSADFTARWLDVTALGHDAVHRVAPFSLVDQDGAAVSNQTLAGKIYVAGFFFTACPSLCPKITRSFQRIQKAYENDPKVRLLLHSVNPSSDTVEVLAKYAREHQVMSGKWHLLRGDKAQIYELARRSYFAEKELGITKGNDEFLHTENMLLVDDHGHLRGVYNATLPAEAQRIIEDIATLEAE